MKKYFVGLSALVVAVDLWLKHWVDTNIPLGQAINVIPGFFELQYVQNTGAAWGMLSGKQVIFMVVTPIVLIGLIYYFVKSKHWLESLACSLFFAGALGNFIDRIVFSYVRDMFAFNIFGYAFPVFNIADMAAVCGVGILILLILKDEMGNKNA